MKSNKKFVILLEILVITFLVMSVVSVCGLSDSSADISAYLSIVNPGDEIRVTYSGAPGFEFDGIAVYKAGEQDIYEYGLGKVLYFLDGKKSGTLTITAPDEPGDYEFRLFENAGSTDIARSNVVRVQAGTTVPTPTPTTPSGVHHLGDQTLSDWEVPKSEGTEYTTTFSLTAVPASADIILDVFNTDHNNPVLVNGNSIGILCISTIKSWKQCTIKIPGSVLRVGSNTLTIQSESRGGNYDDFMIRNIGVTPSSGVHHLGDQTLSDWEVPKSEGTEYTTTFSLTAVPASADIILDVFDTDYNNPVLVNGNSVGFLCIHTSESWTQCTIKIPGSALRVGSNTLTIQSESRGGNYDDFMIRNIGVTPSSDAKPTPTPTTLSGVHHLGDQTLSDWEVPKSEGTEYTTTFSLTAVPASADIILDVFHTDHNNPVLVNGNSVGILCINTIKSWKQCTIKIPGSALRVGSNTLTIQSESRGGNYDDFMIRNIGVTGTIQEKSDNFNHIVAQPAPQKVLIGQNLQFDGFDGTVAIYGLVSGDIANVYQTDANNRIYNVNWPMSGAFYVNYDSTANTYDAQLSVEEPDMPLVLKVGTKEVSSIAVGTNLIIDTRGMNLYPEDQVDLVVIGPDGQIEHDEVNDQQFTDITVDYLTSNYGDADNTLETAGWTIGAYICWVKTDSEYACGLDAVSNRKELVILKGAVSIEAVKTSAVELETVKLIVTGVAGDEINVAASPLSDDVVFKAGIDDTPMDATNQFNHKIDEDGTRKYAVEFNNKGIYRIKVTVIDGPRKGDSDTEDITVSEKEMPLDLPAPIPSEGGLVGYWNFNEGSGNIAYDSSGSGNDGTIHGATWVDNGSCEKALSFDGVEDYVETNPATFQSNDITVEAWIYPKSFSSYKNILHKGDRIGANNFLFVLLLNSNKIRFDISSNGNHCDSIVGTTSLELNKWYHVVGVYRSSDKFYAVYVNGTEDNSKTSTLSSLYHDASKYWIGARYDNRQFVSDRYFNGIIDEVRIYDRALSEEEIQEDMNECAPTSTIAPPEISGKGDCKDAGGYWYNNQCNEEEEESGYGDIKVTYISWEEVQEKYTVSYDETFKYDDDGDGANEATLYYKGENNMVMSSDDTDKDGKVDLIFHYDDEEFLMRAIRDTDGDGELDQILHFNREEEIIKVEKIRSDDTKNSILFITLGGIIIFLVMSFWLYVIKKQSYNLKMNELNYMGRINHQVGERLFPILISFLIIFVLLVSPVSSLEDVIDDDCNIIQDVFDRDWKKYSDLENTPYTFKERPLTARSTQTQYYYAAQSKIVDAEVQIFFLKRDAEVDRRGCLKLKELKKALVHEQRVNLLKSFWRLSYYTAATTYKAYRVGESIGGCYVNLMTTMSSVSELGSTLKIITDGYYQLSTNSLAFADNTQSITEATEWGTFGTSLSAFYEMLESLGDPKKIGVAVFTQVSREAEATLPSATLSDEEVDILRTQYLKSHKLDHTTKQRYKEYLERKDKVRELEAQIKGWENELVEWEAKEKSRVKESLVDSCKKEKEKKCDSEHLYLCVNEKDCKTADGYWYNNNCNDEPEEEDTSDGDTSDGEFNCLTPIPNEASHIVEDYSEYWIEYWVTPNGFVGPYYSWYDREKTKKHSFSCYNIEGEQHGLAKMWYEDGTLHTEQNYKDGEFQGVWRMWYEDGTPQFEDNYKDGKLHGVSKCWYYDGTLNYEHNYKDGKLHGVCKRWDKDGKIHRECNYEEGNCVSCVHGRC